MSYQDPHFHKGAYKHWRANSTAEERRNVRRAQSARGYALVSDVHPNEGISRVSDKPISKKALRKNSKRARKLQGVQ